jgi:hypothetical protein
VSERVDQPPQKPEDGTPPYAYRRRMIFYAVVSDQIEQVIEFYKTSAEAEAMLDEVLKDEPVGVTFSTSSPSSS